MFEKTTHTEVTAKAAIYAVPRTEHEISTSEDGCPFEYLLKTNAPWQDGTIKLHEVELSEWLPAGIPLLEKAIETLKEAIAEEERESQKRVTAMQARIDALALIEYIPVPEADDFDDSMDGDHDSAMASAGHGTDEDYGGTDERL